MPTLQSFVDFFVQERPAWARSPSALNMPERFDRHSRMISFIAHEHARSGGQNCVDTGHLLLALSEDSKVRPLLESSGVDVAQLQAKTLSMQTQDAVSYARDGVLPRSSVLHLTWQIAQNVADEDSALHITPTHLLIATGRALREVSDTAILPMLGRLIGRV